MNRVRLAIVAGLLFAMFALYAPFIPVKSNAYFDVFACVGMRGGYESISYALTGWGAMWNTPCMASQGTLFMPGAGESFDVLNTGFQGSVWLTLDILPFMLVILIVAISDRLHLTSRPSLV